MPMYSRRHYQDAAAHLRDTKASKKQKEDMANRFAADNPRFDRTRFMAAAASGSEGQHEYIVTMRDGSKRRIKANSKEEARRKVGGI